MGRFAKAIAVLLLCSVAQAQEVMQDRRTGLVHLVNNTSYFMSCEINTNVGRVFWQLYPGKSSGGYQWIEIVECY
jgi:hypothetical protein